MKRTSSSSKNKSSSSKRTVKIDFKDDSILKMQFTTPKNNKINVNFIANPKKPDLSLDVKE